MNSATFTRLYYLSLVILFGSMSLITFLLIKEYQHFKQQADELGALKEEYNSHIITLKRLLVETEQNQEESEIEDEKKKTLEIPFC